MRHFTLLCSVAALALPVAAFAATGDMVTSSPTRTAPVDGSGTASSSNAMTGTGATTGSGYSNGMGGGAGSTAVTGNINATRATGVGAQMDAQPAEKANTQRIQLSDGMWAEGKDWKEGTSVQVSKDGKTWMAAPNGTHTSKDGHTVITTQNGMITTVKKM